MLATPRDIMLEQLRIECFYPADAATEAHSTATCRLRGSITQAPAGGRRSYRDRLQ